MEKLKEKKVEQSIATPNESKKGSIIKEQLPLELEQLQKPGHRPRSNNESKLNLATTPETHGIKEQS